MQTKQRRFARNRHVYRQDYTYFDRTKEIKQGVFIPTWVLPLFFALATLAFLIWFFTSAPWLAVKHITIEGQATSEVIKEINKLKGQNVLWLSITRPETAIIQHQPSIKEIQILRGIPDTLRVKLIERKPALLWQVSNQLYTIDATGFVYKQELLASRDGTYIYPDTNLAVVTDTKGIPVEIGQTAVRSDFISFIQLLQERLPADYGLKFLRAEINETTFNVSILTDAGWKVMFDTTRKIEPQLKTLKDVLDVKRAEIKEYLDLRVRGWVYYK